MGIETSCDDTGVAIIDTDGVILAESLISQSEFHAQMGGILPLVARELHVANLSKAVDEAFQKSNLTPSDLSAIAVTTRPGLVVCLKEGLAHARQLAIKARLPLIPIHHMEAHALTPRLGKTTKTKTKTREEDGDDEEDHLPFPFLVLLISGGHCILSLVRGISDFVLLGNCLNAVRIFLYEAGTDRWTDRANSLTDSLFRCVHASLYEGLSVGPSVRRSVGPWIRCAFFLNRGN